MNKFDPNKPYCRRDRKPAKIVYSYKDGKHHVVISESVLDVEFSYSVRSNGRVDDYTESGYDLVNIPEKIEGWVNIHWTDPIYKSIEDANKCKGSDVYACIKVSFTEGEGLE